MNFSTKINTQMLPKQYSNVVFLLLVDNILHFLNENEHVAPRYSREKYIYIAFDTCTLLDLNTPIVAKHRTDVLNRIFKRIMDDEEITQYFLRHTFATVCQQYVRPDIVDIWMGDSSERLVGRVYTHFPDKFLREQMNLVQFYA